MKAKNNLMIIAISLVSVLMIAGTIISFAWFARFYSMSIDKSSGSLLTQYFHSGTGTQEDPYVITRPLHYYNLVMLYQANPEFSDSNFIDASLYFRVGTKDLNNDGQDELDEYSVFNYLDDGTTDSTPSKILNLSAYPDGLLPIGTANKPFQANFDGSDITLSNLTVVGTSELDGITYKTPDIGVFGYVSQNAKIHNVFINDLLIDLSDIDSTAGYQSVDSQLSSTHIPHTGTAFVGYIAGHIVTGAQVNDVYVNNCAMTGGQAATNEFGYFGHVEDPSGVSVTTLGSEIATQRAKGDNAGFGGSLDMKNMHERLQGIWEVATEQTTYVSSETVVINEVNNTKSVTATGNSTSYVYRPSTNTTYPYRYYHSEYAGKYYFYERNDMENYQFMAMYGESSRNPKTVTTYVEKDNYLNAYYIRNGQTYLSVSANNLVGTSTSGTAAKWLFDAQNHLYTYINREVYYLNNSGITGVSLSVSPSTVWSRTGNNELITAIDGRQYYLDYQDNWLLTSVRVYYYLSDGNGNYLSLNGTGIVNTTSESSAVKWQADISGSSYTFHTVIGNNVYYLNYNGTLSVSTTSSAWIKEGDALTVDVQGIKHLLTFDSSTNTWAAIPATGKKITDGNSHYLSSTTLGTIDSSQADSVVWQFSSDTGVTTIYTIINGVKYYLIYNDGLKVSQVPVNWNRDGNSFYYTSGTTNYYLKYENGWIAKPLQYYVIGDGNGNYLKATGGNTFENTLTASDATHFSFSQMEGNPGGVILYNINGTSYYLGNNNGSFSNTTTNWINDGNGHLYAENTEFYLIYDNGWKIADCAVYYTISDGNGHYLNANSSYNGFEVGTAANATRWKFSNISNINSPSGTISVQYGGTTRYIRINTSSSCGSTTYTLQLSTTTSNNSWTNNNGILNNTSQSGHYISYSDNAWTQSTSGTTLTTSIQQVSPTTVSGMQISETPPVVVVESVDNYSLAASISGSFTINHTLTFTETTQQEIVKTVAANVRGGYQTYFPLRIATSDETNWYDATDPYRVSNKNTGYIISGARIEDTSAAANQKWAGDIRISYFPISSIDASYSTTDSAFTSLYTVDSSGNHTMTDEQKASSVYQNAAGQLLEALNGSSSIYGLHFMDAQISKDYLLTADKAVVLGKTYENYEMPLDSINFQTVERGTISFFAGSYFSNNDTFFSLHQVFRDENSKITDIKEITEIYEHTTLGVKRPYIYKFSDGTYSDADGKYTGATTLNSDYASVFNTSWITNPTGVSTENKIYYFEIPCNKGEFCLGSVSGKTGAYLIYLDIATNGGDVISKVISSEGNDVTNAFKADYRDAPDILQEGHYSDILFAVTAPAGTDSSTFSVSVNFDKTVTEPEFENGLYTITVLNKSGSDIQLDVYLCDDDRDATNDFLYAYKIIYTNADYTEQIIQTAIQTDYWQSMASFSVPASGIAEEVSYSAGG